MGKKERKEGRSKGLLHCYNNIIITFLPLITELRTTTIIMIIIIIIEPEQRVSCLIASRCPSMLCISSCGLDSGTLYWVLLCSPSSSSSSSELYFVIPMLAFCCELAFSPIELQFSLPRKWERERPNVCVCVSVCLCVIVSLRFDLLSLTACICR